MSAYYNGPHFPLRGSAAFLALATAIMPISAALSPGVPRYFSAAIAQAVEPAPQQSPAQNPEARPISIALSQFCTTYKDVATEAPHMSRDPALSPYGTLTRIGTTDPATKMMTMFPWPSTDAQRQSKPVTPLPAKRSVTLDPGHGEWVPETGQYDPGAIFRQRHAAPIMEKDLNLKLGLAVRDALEYRGVTVTMTRTGDFMGEGNRHATLLSLGSTKIDQSDAFVSLHFNRFAGKEIIYNGDSDMSRKFAESFGRVYGIAPRSDYRGLAVLREDVHVRNNNSRQPAILVENGDIDSKRDRDSILNPKLRAVVADRIASSIVNALKGVPPVQQNLPRPDITTASAAGSTLPARPTGVQPIPLFISGTFRPCGV